tara:strand:- start:3736 stop:4137 length:402 start_codon:yes stop_codon:yes gene_type:complete
MAKAPKKPVKPKKLTKKQIARQERIAKKKALVQWSLDVRERDGNQCQVCKIKDKELKENGKKAILNAHHVFAKEGTYKFMMFDVENGLTLCQACHRFSRVNSPHRQEFVFFLWFMENRPEQFEYLKSRILPAK